MSEVVSAKPIREDVRVNTRLPERICLVGAADDTGNLGVSALMRSVLVGLARRSPEAQLTVFDNRDGLRRSAAVVDGQRFEFERFGMWPSRRVHRPESLWNMRVSARLGGARNPGVQRLMRADAVWDISGGDSFGDLYGAGRWHLVMQPKKLALRQGRPLFLLPQTYGPYLETGHREAASAVVKTATMAWARDADSYEVLCELAGEQLDPARHRCGVDVAFALDAQEPVTLTDGLDGWLGRPRPYPLVGLNISGLLYNDELAARKYGLRADYRAVAWETLTRLLERTEARVLLVAHVQGGGAESDSRAIDDLVATLSGTHRERVKVVQGGLDAAGVKWVIGELDWFCGTRMHATIAALSMGVPSAAVAYSLKTRGVFRTCGVEDQVVDARETDAKRIADRILRSYCERKEVSQRLAAALPSVSEAAEMQMDALVAGISGSPKRQGPDRHDSDRARSGQELYQ